MENETNITNTPLTVHQSDVSMEHLHLLTTAELLLMLTVITGCLYERGIVCTHHGMVGHPGTTQADDLDGEFDEIDEELDRAKMQRWLIVALNIALSILIEILF